MIQVVIIFLSMAVVIFFVAVVVFINSDKKEVEPYKPTKENYEDETKKNNEAIKEIDKKIEGNKIDKNTDANTISAMFNSTSRN